MGELVSCAGEDNLASAFSAFCSTSRIGTPCPRTEASTLKISFTTSGATPNYGSSLGTMRGFAISARAMAAVEDPMHVETSFRRNLGELVRIRPVHRIGS
jgi:hypothetical protein